MKKLILFLVFTVSVMAQNPIKSYSDSLYLGDSVNVHIFANPHNYLRITITSDTASVTPDTVYVYSGSTTNLLSQVGVKSLLTGDHLQAIAPGVVSELTTGKQYWLYVPGGAYLVMLQRCNTVLSKVKYTIESFN